MTRQRSGIFRAGTLFLPPSTQQLKGEWRPKGENLTEPLSELGERGMTIRDSFPSLVRRKGAEKITQCWMQINSHGMARPSLCWIINSDPGSPSVLWVRSSVQQVKSTSATICCALNKIGYRRVSNYQIVTAWSRDGWKKVTAAALTPFRMPDNIAVICYAPKDNTMWITRALFVRGPLCR